MYLWMRHNKVENARRRKHTKTNKCEGTYILIPLCAHIAHVGIRRTISFFGTCNGMVGNCVSVEVTIMQMIQTLE